LASAITIKSASIFPPEIEPGKTARITLNLKNNLNEDVKDISVRLDLGELPFAPYKSSNEISFDSLNEDESISIIFEIMALADAKSGIYKIPILILYKNEEGVEKEKESIISLTISSKPILSIEIEKGLLLKGQNNEVAVRIVNKGLSDVRFLEIQIGKSPHYNLISQSKIYLGDIDSDDFDSAEFNLFFKLKSPNTINLPLTITYRDTMNNEYEENRIVGLKVYSKEQATELGLIKESKTFQIIGGIGIIIVIYILYRKIRKRRVKKI